MKHGAPISYKSLLSGSVLTLGIKVGGLGAAFLLHFLLAKVLPIESYGIYSFVVAMAVLAAIFGRLSLDQVTIRLISQYRDDPARVWGVIRWSFVVTFGLCTLLSLGIVYYGISHAKYGTVVIHSIPIVYGVAFALLGQGVLRAYGYTALGFAPELLGRPGLTLLLVAVFLGLGLTVDLDTALILQSAAAFAMGLLAVWFVWIAVPDDVRHTTPVYDSRGWLTLALPLFWGNVLLLGEPQLIVLIAGQTLEAADVALVSITSRLAALGAIATVAVNMFITPQIARLYHDGDMQGLQGLIRKASWLMTAPVIPALVIFAIAGKWILGWFGEAYVAAYPLLLIFAASRCLVAMTGPLAILLTMSRHERSAAAVASSSIGIMIVGAILLAPLMGAIGVAWAVLLATLVRVIANWLLAWRKLGIRSGIGLGPGHARAVPGVPTKTPGE